MVETFVEAQPISRADASVFETDIPDRLDRLPWGNFHTLLVLALGITWFLEGLGVTLAETLSRPIVKDLRLDDDSLAHTAYLGGAILGALFFGRRADRYGRRYVFIRAAAFYCIFTFATAMSVGLLSLAVFRFLAGFAIGGEYAAINSTIQEFVPKKYRGHAVLAVNGSFWIGAAIGAVSSLLYFDPTILGFGPIQGWRITFVFAALLTGAIILMRRWIPESPRWLMTHHRAEEAAAVVALIEERLRQQGKSISSACLSRVSLRGRRYTPRREVALTFFDFYRNRALVGLALMAAQAFCYNAIFFNYDKVLEHYFNVGRDDVGWYFLAFALSNFAGPIVLGRFFDTVGRKLMISLTYASSGFLLASSACLFISGHEYAWLQAAAWTIVFFFVSAAASSAYLTVGETFPLEIRAFAIGVFYAIGTGIVVFSPQLFRALIDSHLSLFVAHPRLSLFVAYLCGAAMMVVAAIVEWHWGVAAEGKALEEVARPLTFTD